MSRAGGGGGGGDESAGSWLSFLSTSVLGRLPSGAAQLHSSTGLEPEPAPATAEGAVAAPGFSVSGERQIDSVRGQRSAFDSSSGSEVGSDSYDDDDGGGGGGGYDDDDDGDGDGDGCGDEGYDNDNDDEVYDESGDGVSGYDARHVLGRAGFESAEWPSAIKAAPQSAPRGQPVGADSAEDANAEEVPDPAVDRSTPRRTIRVVGRHSQTADHRASEQGLTAGSYHPPPPPPPPSPPPQHTRRRQLRVRPHPQPLDEPAAAFPTSQHADVIGAEHDQQQRQGRADAAGLQARLRQAHDAQLGESSICVAWSRLALHPPPSLPPPPFPLRTYCWGEG
jgi:hypothetical protein